MFKYLITQKVSILVVEARPSMDGLDPPLAPNRSDLAVFGVAQYGWKVISDVSAPPSPPVCWYVV